jgi:predicted acylesterase/phospholipase RssA
MKAGLSGSVRFPERTKNASKIGDIQMALYKILSIDGGGIRGVIPAVLLSEIEKRTGESVSSLFDLISGTSTGGILAAGLVVPASPDRKSGSRTPKFRASDLLALYEEYGKDIFRRSLCDKITSLWGWMDEKYPNDGIETVLSSYFGNTELKDGLTEILVTSYEIEERQPYFFKRRRARENPQERNHFLRDVARATSAAPTYFEPAKVHTVGKTPAKTRYLVDGGVFANDPALCAYAEAISLGESPENILLVSLGTGVATERIDYGKAKDWGKGSWAKPVIGMMMDGVADAVDYQLQQILPTESPGAKYYRFNTDLPNKLGDLDATNRSNINALKQEAKRILEDPIKGPKFDALCGKLKLAERSEPQY